MTASDIQMVVLVVLTNFVLLVLPCLLAPPIARWLEAIAGRVAFRPWGGHPDGRALAGEGVPQLDLAGVVVEPGIGVGPLRFGARPGAAKAALGPPLDWNAWGDGNLNDSLVYDGVRLVFDRCGAEPLPRSRLCGAEVRRADAVLLGRPLAEWDEGELAAELARLGFRPRVAESGYAEFAFPYLAAWFEAGRLARVEVAE
ncbi:hypothetical protein R5W24_006176 [Gemmata sp. JC717]|uniref:hypothetical protein n=1 Tax=Gemmata algarum TaxID=2975278 RepID=UPI0021BB28F6|nr:hypothetical protein [Gemmata algarum]MDY3556993.1 hypothetical protein [Gemmata algarum]